MVALRFLFFLFVLYSPFMPLCQSTGKGVTSWGYCRNIKRLFNNVAPECVMRFDEDFSNEQVEKMLIAEYGQYFLDTVPSVCVTIPVLFDQHEVKISVMYLHGLNKPINNNIYCGLRPDYLHILINSNDEFLIDGEFSVIDSVMAEVFEYYRSFNLTEGYDFTEARIVIKWQDLTSPTCLQNTLHQVCLGYIQFVEYVMQTKLCELSKKEIVKIRQKYTLGVSFFQDGFLSDEEIKVVDP